MEDVSNKTVAILLMVALIISLGGALISLNRLTGARTIGITGLASGDKNVTLGNLSVTVSDITWLNYTQRKCFMGSGYVLRNKCELNSSGSTNGYNASSCSTTFGSTNTCTLPLEIKNIGNNNVTLNITFKNNSAFLQPTSGELWFKMVNGTKDFNSQGCREAGTKTMQNFDRKWQQVFSAGQGNMTCQRFYYGFGANIVSIHLRIRIAQGAPAGYKQNVITAQGKAI
jgi:hypothetical protein